MQISPQWSGPPALSNPAFVRFLQENRYYEIRELPDGTVAGLLRLIYTTSICTGLDWQCWAYRWCFEEESTARSELERLQAMDDEPQGYIARRIA